MNALIKILVFIAILLLPLDSVPYILPSTYSPISIYPLIIAFPLILSIYFTKIKTIKKSNLILICFYIYSIISSFLFSNFVYDDNSGFIDFFVTLTIGVVVYLVFDYYFSLISEEFNTNEKYFEWVFKLIGNVYIFVLLYGVYEILSMLGILPGILENFINTLLDVSGGSRITLLSGEPSWATFHLIFIIPIYWYLKKYNKRYNKYFYLAILLLIMTFSMQGYIILLAAMLLNMLYQKKIRLLLKYLFLISIFIILFILVLPIFSNLFEGMYFVNRFSKINNLTTIGDIFYLDSSVFTRTIYPIIGLLIFKKNPLFGVGGGNFRFELGGYITKYFPKGLRFPPVVDNITGEVSNPFNMLSRLLSETGIIGTGLFTWFVYSIFKKIKINLSSISRDIGMFLIFSICIYLQFDSFAFIQPWLAFAIVNNSKSKEGLKQEVDSVNLKG